MNQIGYKQDLALKPMKLGIGNKKELFPDYTRYI